MRTISRGFTIVELMIVIAVIGVLTTISVVSFGQFQANARDNQRASDINAIAEALEKYYDNNGEYPSCAAMTQSSSTITTSVLPGLNTSVLTVPLGTSGTNSITCSCLTQPSGGTYLPVCSSLGSYVSTDAYAYVGDGTTDCSTGTFCLTWTLQYRSEATGKIVSVSSRRGIGTPTVAVNATSSSAISVTWGAAQGATSYNIQCAVNSGFSVGLVQTSTSSLTTSFTGLAASTTYYCQAQATNGLTTTDWSATASATTLPLAWAQQTLGRAVCASSSSDGTKLVLGTSFSNGVIYSTNSGVSWTSGTASGEGCESGNGLASSSDGTKLIIDGGNTTYPWTSSSSGANWTEQTSGGTIAGGPVASSSNGTILVESPKASGYIYTSTNSGVSWTQQTGLGSRQWAGIASSSDGSKLVAVSGGSAPYISTNSGSSWTALSSPVDQWRAVASSSDGSKLVAVAYTVGRGIYTSSNSGTSWTQQSISGSHYWVDVASSSDGTRLIAADLNGYLYISGDSGVTWTAQTSAGTHSWSSVASSSDGTRLIATTTDGTSATFFGTYQ